jgi:hypothetical protein
MKVRALEGRFADLGPNDRVEVTMTVGEMDALAGAVWADRARNKVRQELAKVGRSDRRDATARAELLKDRPSFEEPAVRDAIALALMQVREWFTSPERAKARSHFGTRFEVEGTPMRVSVMRDIAVVVFVMPDRYWDHARLPEWGLTETEGELLRALVVEHVAPVEHSWNGPPFPTMSFRVELEKGPEA